MKQAGLAARVFVSGLVLVIACGALLAAESAAPTAAAGNGTMTFGEDGHGVGLFEFEVARHGSGLDGSLLFAAEDHHDYPEIIVRMDDIEQAEFTQRSIKFSGKGKLHEAPVTVSVSASDGAGTVQPDRFSIICTDAKGTVVLEAEGELSTGDIRVGEED